MIVFTNLEGTETGLSIEPDLPWAMMVHLQNTSKKKTIYTKLNTPWKLSPIKLLKYIFVISKKL